jgi:hypothetical protein
MAWTQISIDPSATYWTQVATLDGTPYLLTFKYNTREAVYYFDISSEDGSIDYALGVKVVPDFPLLRTYGAGGGPPGEIVAMRVDTTSDAAPALGELGTGKRVLLVYVDATDLYAANAEPERNPGPFISGIFTPGA